MSQDDPWFAEFERDLAQTTRRDEAALAAKIAILEEELAKLREQVNGFDARLRS